MAINHSGYSPSIPLTKSIIGPPLKETLNKVLGEIPEEKIDSIISSFKIFYDSEGYKKSVIYEGMDELLKALKKSSTSLYLATNKRLAPTEKIIEYFGWQDLFTKVYAIDKQKYCPFMNKAEMIGSLLKQECIQSAESLYIGDRLEDVAAAEKNNLSTILVNWGYEDFSALEMRGLRVAESPIQLQTMILNHP